ncbi:MAG: hypothetical protein AAFU57_06755 [Bacteroidota bacterium]
MLIHQILRYFIISLLFIGCRNHRNSEIVRNDLLIAIKEFIVFSEENAKEAGNIKQDTDIYWVEFVEIEDDKIVVIMQQPFYYSSNLDGYMEIRENLVFFYNSNTVLAKRSRLNKDVPEEIPDENSQQSDLGYSAPNWAYLIKGEKLVKTFVGE